MALRPSVPEIITVNSESLQTQIRDLLPSQNGFGSELQATNVITPIIDLTSAAEGSGLAFNLQTAIAFGSQTAFSVNNTSTVIANSPGFYRATGAVSMSGGATRGSFTMTDGFSVKTVLTYANNSSTPTITTFDYVFWLASGESLTAVSLNGFSQVEGSIRQVADSDGQLVNPSGYPL
jgi:hypothetical protein